MRGWKLLTFKLDGANSSEQMDINRKVGRLGEKIAKDDYHRNGYHICDTKPGMFFDFIAVKFNMSDWKLELVFVEVKVGDSQLSRRQRWFKHWCKKAGQDFEVYRISTQHLRYLVENGTIEAILHE